MGNYLGQYCINVTDLKRSTDFYENVIGLKVTDRIEIPGVNEVVLAGEDGSKIQLAHHADHTGPIDHGNAFWKLYVYTDDCAGLYERALAAGCESVTAPKRLDRWPVTAAFILDPDGYNVEILQRHPE